MSQELRFAFGKNWSQFLKNLTDDRIEEAKKSLVDKLGDDSLKGKVFLDIGSGSGLFSLAAYLLGAKVFSFDYDTDSVNCTQFLKEKYAPNSGNWSVQQGSVLDTDFLKQFDKVDILYSWGVLHHTGNMIKAFENVANIVKDDGKLFISIYNDQGGASRLWKKIKFFYNNGNCIKKFILLSLSFLRLWGPTFIKDLFKYLNPFKTWQFYKVNRGMSPWHDVVDWVGGYPFEVAKPEEVFEFFKNKGFYLEKLKTCAGGLGCNEFVFIKKA